MKIIGIDPGTSRVGYGVIKKEGRNYTHLDSGILKVPDTDIPNQLLTIEKELSSLLEKSSPDIAGLEKLFFSKNRKTAIKVAQARGIIIRTLTKQGVNFKELSPTKVKSAVTGNGRASKEAVAKMVGYFLKGPDLDDLLDDATDALAIAIAAGDYIKNGSIK